MKTNNNRRQFLTNGAKAAGFIAMATPIARSLAATCGMTPPQTPGPFYPGQQKFEHDTDLTRVPGHTSTALGQVVYIRGKVLDSKCAPIPNANVEIWQACASGKYNNPKDPNPAPIDENFKYWAETYTDQTGAYLFKTIIPGAYPADVDWVRPSHIHFKISCMGFKELVTQMYFKGDALNDCDLILNQIPANERQSVIVEFASSPAGFDPNTLIGDFDITLQRVRPIVF